MNDSTQVTIPVTLPQALLFDQGLSRQAASTALLQAYVISLYRQDRISTGKAARLLGMHRLSFIRLLAEEGIAYLDYTPEELEADVKAMEQWANE